MQKLILGTAQFGIPNYGVKQDGQPSIKEIEYIARIAWDGGIRVIHTSWQYNLPKICDAIFDQFERISKDWERPELFIWNNESGKSIYHPSEMNGPYRMIMIPINILDNRFKNIWTHKSGLVIARSVFLQGLLLMGTYPFWLSKSAKIALIEFEKACSKHNLMRYEAALGWVLGLKDVDHVIVGVNSAEQLAQLLDVKPLQWDYDFSITDENVLDPRRLPILNNQLKRSVETSTAIEGVNIKL